MAVWGGHRGVVGIFGGDGVPEPSQNILLQGTVAGSEIAKPPGGKVLASYVGKLRGTLVGKPVGGVIHQTELFPNPALEIGIVPAGPAKQGIFRGKELFDPGIADTAQVMVIPGVKTEVLYRGFTRSSNFSSFES